MVLLSKVMAVDLAAENIRVNVLAPGPVDTPLVAGDAFRRHPPALARPHADAPLRPAGGTRRLGRVPLLDDASFITGHVLAVDGGMVASGLTAATH